METCPQCGARFFPNRMGRARTFCSRDCQVKHLRANGPTFAPTSPPIEGGGIRMTVILPPDVYGDVRRLADHYNVTASAMARLFIVTGLEQMEEVA